MHAYIQSSGAFRPNGVLWCVQESFPGYREAEPFVQMQNRLAAVQENQAAQTAQLREVQAAIEAEKAARPESVSILSLVICACH